MNEDAARQILATLGIPVLSRSQTGWLQAHCPLAPWTHRKGTDRKPAFAVKCDDAGVSVYKCLACHYKGRVSQLVRTLEEFRDHDYPGLALQADMADASGAFGGGFDVTKTMVGFEEPEPIDEHAIKGAYPAAYSVHAAAAYLDSRGISGSTAEELGLCFDPDDMRVLFPVRGRQRELYGFSGRTILTDPSQFPYRRYPKVRDYLGLPKRSLLLGLDGYQPGKPFFATEGLIGYARLVENGVREICNPVALLGSEMTPQKASILAEFDERVYLMPDPDEAGDSCLWGHVDERTNDHNGDGAVSRLRRKGLSVFIPEWPEHTGGDIDLMAFEDVQDILARCPMYLGEG